jgi:hypothetical protein
MQRYRIHKRCGCEVILDLFHERGQNDVDTACFMMKPYQKRCLTSGIENLMGLQLTRVTILLLRAQYPGAMNLKEDGFLLLSVFDNILEAVGDLYEEGYFQRLIVLIV